MKKLRRALLRGVISGVLFSATVLGVFVVTEGPPPGATGELLLIFAALAFLTALVVGPVSAIELRASDIEPSISRDLFAGFAALFFGTLGVILGALQFGYLEATFKGGDPIQGLKNVEKMLDFLLRDPRPAALCLAFAVPFPVITVSRLRRLHALIELPVAVVVAGAASFPLVHVNSSKMTVVTGLVGGAAFALSLGTRFADALAGGVEQWLDPEGLEAPRPEEKKP